MEKLQLKLSNYTDMVCKVCIVFSTELFALAAAPCAVAGLSPIAFAGLSPTWPSESGGASASASENMRKMKGYERWWKDAMICYKYKMLKPCQPNKYSSIQPKPKRE